MQSVRRETALRRPVSDRDAWPVSWSAVWVGTLTALAVALLFGLAGTALGAFQATDGIAAGDTFGWLMLLFSVFGAFLAFVAGGWVAAQIAGFRHAEPAALHGALTWLVALPLLLALAGLGAGALFGTWFGGLAGTPSWAATGGVTDPASAEAARNTALGALTALILGLAGSVLGGWMASGEPMSAGYYRSRSDEAADRRAA